MVFVLHYYHHEHKWWETRYIKLYLLKDIWEIKVSCSLSEAEDNFLSRREGLNFLPSPACVMGVALTQFCSCLSGRSSSVVGVAIYLTLTNVFSCRISSFLFNLRKFSNLFLLKPDIYLPLCCFSVESVAFTFSFPLHWSLKNMQCSEPKEEFLSDGKSSPLLGRLLLSTAKSGRHDFSTWCVMSSTLSHLDPLSAMKKWWAQSTAGRGLACSCQVTEGIGHLSLAFLVGTKALNTASSRAGVLMPEANLPAEDLQSQGQIYSFSLRE